MEWALEFGMKESKQASMKEANQAWDFEMKDSKQALMKEANQAWELHCLSSREQSIEVFRYRYDLEQEERRARFGAA